MNLLDGKKTAQELYAALQGDVADLKEKGIHPKLVIILVGDNPASLSYIKSKQKASEQVGIESELLRYTPEEMDTEKLITKIHELNADDKVHGILVQLPSPNIYMNQKLLKRLILKRTWMVSRRTILGRCF